MINPNELRVFNKVSYKDRIETIYAVSCHYNGLRKLVITDSQVDIENGYWIGCEEIDPIPLTPEWLDRCGFKDDLPWKKGNFGLDSENRFNVVDGTGYGVIVARNIRYVHQLQNLCFALTGEELIIKEPV